MTISNKVFVFGSNLAGRHGKGAALHALREHGAIYGVGVGPQGNSYAIPTKGFNLDVLPLIAINKFVHEFLRYARENSDKEFLVTNIGCGLAGYTPNQIAPMFKGASLNCEFSSEFLRVLERL